MSDGADVIHIDDPADPRVADYVGLTDPDLRRRTESEQGFFIAESPLVVERLIATGRSVRSVLVTPRRHEDLAGALVGLDAPVYVAPPAVLREVVGFDLHRGAVAAADRWLLPAPGEILGDAPRRIAVLQKVNDHENLGVLFRSAAAFGIDAVLLDPERSDPLYRRTVRVSIGHVLTVPWTRVADLDDVRAAGFSLLAFTPRADAVPLDTLEWPARSAVMLGAEGPGLDAAWIEGADVRVRIPMRADVDSLNVATTASIAFYAGR